MRKQDRVFPLTIEGVWKEYPGLGVSALAGIDLRVEAGEALAVSGPSGSGKTSLLHIMGALDAPSRGRILIMGEDPSAMGPAQSARLRRDHIGIVFQEHRLLPYLSLLENVLLPAAALGAAERRRRSPELLRRASGLIRRMGLEGRERHRPHQLSGGERQRAALARALILGPSILLADEPTGALDSTNAELLASLLMEIRDQEGLTLVLATHSENLAGRMRRRVNLLDGRLA
jgi:ABC-type lipoprotein export system ATPase subunit